MKIVLDHKHPDLLVYGPDNFPDDPLELEKGLLEVVSFDVRTTPLAEGRVATPYGKFTFQPMPGNCGIVVSTDTWIEYGMRNCGSASRLHIVKEALARKLGYSMMLSTTISTNVPQVVSAAKAGWKFVSHFTNKRSGNVCLIGVKHLK